MDRPKLIPLHAVAAHACMLLLHMLMLMLLLRMLLPHTQPQEAGGVQAAACGSNHSVLLTDSGAVYTAGCNSSGQCGQDKGLKEVSS